MTEQQKKFSWYKIVDNIEIYIGTAIFLILLVLLTVQVAFRYIFGISFSWIEEISTILMMSMVYCGVAGAVRGRKFLRIEILVDKMPFKIKRILLIFDNLMQAAWIVFMLGPFFNVMKSIGGGRTSILRLPKFYIYAVIPVLLILTLIRTAQEINILMHEHETQLGKSKPAIDLDAIVRERDEALAAKNGGASQ
ncbi:TRAP transporter small permease [Fusibacter paucivorans]|uniref:TRAP transporter small permease n=1 Tax=Fusibacter paucivorans TaxID=76009 RepID=A0ABS5PMP3_9FIRM|nr:TRAP transporter small permease [Fusibacter paucivorans]MBS7526449.1 TRAP transporter small permease [Fusibacter paucivorans]